MANPRGLSRGFVFNSSPSDNFRPLHLRFLAYDPVKNNFSVLIDKGSSKGIDKTDFDGNIKSLFDYFFIGLALPNDSFWVNLRPDGENGIIDEELAKTDIGRILLESDLQLKKDVARFTSPATPEGRAYWERLYKKAEETFGGKDIKVPTLTRPWIVPDEVLVAEAGGGAYVFKATLKVLLEQDYLKGSSVYAHGDQRLKSLNEYSSELIRELIIPRITREVNSAERYSALRQVYYSLILAQWFKARFRNEEGRYASLIDTRNLKGLVSGRPWSKAAYFTQYRKSFRDGEYDMRQETYTTDGQAIRSYFSGGINLTPSFSVNNAFPGDFVPDGPNMISGTYDRDTAGIRAGPQPHFGHSGNEIDNLFIRARQAVLQGDFGSAKRYVQEAVGLLRVVDFEELDGNGFPVADTVNQAEVAVWVLEQLVVNGIKDDDILELLKQLRMGVNGLELKRAFGYSSAFPDDDPVIKDIDAAIRQKAAGRNCVMTIEGAAGSGKNYIGDRIKKRGVAGFTPADIAVIDSDDFLPEIIDDGFDRLVVDEQGREFVPLGGLANYCQFGKFEENFLSLSQAHRLVVVVGLFAPLFFQKSHLKDPDIRVLMKNNGEVNRIRVIRRDGYPDRYVESMGQCEEVQGLLKQPFDVIVNNGNMRLSGSTLNKQNPDGFSFVAPQIYGKMTGATAWEITTETELEALSDEIEKLIRPALPENVDLLSLDVSETEAVIAGVFSLIRHLFSAGEQSLSITVRTFEKGVEVVVIGRKEPVISGEEIFGDRSALLQPLKSHIPEIVITSPKGWCARVFLGRWENDWIIPKGVRYAFAIPNYMPGCDLEFRGRSPDGGARKIPGATTVSADLSRENDNGFGGIDFRYLPVVDAAIRHLKAANGRLPAIDLDSEWREIERLVHSGITPSAERVKEYLQVSCGKGKIIRERRKIISCLSDILRRQEERDIAAEPLLRDILITLEAGLGFRELKTIFIGAKE